MLISEMAPSRVAESGFLFCAGPGSPSPLVENQ